MFYVSLDFEYGFSTLTEKKKIQMQSKNQNTVGAGLGYNMANCDPDGH